MYGNGCGVNLLNHVGCMASRACDHWQGSFGNGDLGASSMGKTADSAALPIGRFFWHDLSLVNNRSRNRGTRADRSFNHLHNR